MALVLRGSGKLARKARRTNPLATFGFSLYMGLFIRSARPKLHHLTKYVSKTFSLEIGPYASATTLIGYDACQRTGS